MLASDRKELIFLNMNSISYLFFSFWNISRQNYCVGFSENGLAKFTFRKLFESLRIARMWLVTVFHFFFPVQILISTGHPPRRVCVRVYHSLLIMLRPKSQQSHKSAFLLHLSTKILDFSFPMFLVLSCCRYFFQKKILWILFMPTRINTSERKTKVTINC